MKKLLSVNVLFAALFLVGCSSTAKAPDFNGLSTPGGKPVAHVSSSNIALHTMFGKNPLVGDASLEKTVSDFTAAARASGAKNVQIVQSKVTKWWFVYPPISFLITPVTSNVAGDALE